MEQSFKQRKDRLDLFGRLRKTFFKQNKIEIPENLYQSCPKCNANYLTEEFQEQLFVCPACGHHARLHASDRIRQICDENSNFVMLNQSLVSSSMDEFEGYRNKVAAYQKLTGMNEAVITGLGKIGTVKTAIAVMDSHFMMGSMGAAVGEKITRLIEYATKKHYPLVIFCASGGARMQEGIISLMQMSKTSAALARFSDQGGFYISVLTDPTTGGVSASFAMLGDIILAEPNALVGFAGRRVIEKTINQQLPDNFQTAEFLLEKGFIDRIIHRNHLKEELVKLLKMHTGGPK